MYFQTWIVDGLRCELRCQPIDLPRLLTHLCDVFVVERLSEDRALRRNLCVSLTGLVCRGCKFNPGLCSEVVEVLFRFQRYHSRSDRPEMYHSQ